MAIPLDALRKPDVVNEDPACSCLICGKVIQDEKSATWVMFDNARCEIVTDEEAETRMEVGAQPIGPACARKHRDVITVYIQGATGKWVKSDEQTGTKYFLAGTSFWVLKPLGAHRRTLRLVSHQRYVAYKDKSPLTKHRSLSEAKRFCEEQADKSGE
jgi:hypothetical protein